MFFGSSTKLQKEYHGESSHISTYRSVFSKAEIQLTTEKITPVIFRERMIFQTFVQKRAPALLRKIYIAISVHPGLPRKGMRRMDKNIIHNGQNN